MLGVSGVAATPRRAAQSLAAACRPALASRHTYLDLAPVRACSLAAVINDNAINNNDNGVDKNDVHSRQCANERSAFGAMIEREDAKVHRRRGERRQ